MTPTQHDINSCFQNTNKLCFCKTPGKNVSKHLKFLFQTSVTVLLSDLSTSVDRERIIFLQNKAVLIKTYTKVTKNDKLKLVFRPR